MDMKKLLHTFDEADGVLNDKIERTNLSTIVASATASVENKKTVLIRGTGRNIEVLKVGGKTVQNGTPTPTNPVEVKGVGDKTVNLFDKDHIELRNGYLLDDSGNETTTTASGYTLSFIPVKPNTVYAPSGNFAEQIASSAYRFYFYDSNKNWISRTEGISALTPNVTFTTPANCYYIRFQYNRNGVKFDTIQIQEGTTATPYEPYNKYKIPILIDGKSQNIYLNAPLFDGEIADLVGGKAEKKYGMVVLDGSENWITGTTQGFTYFGLLKTGTAIANAKNNTVAYSDYQVGISTANIAENIYVNSSGYLIILTQKLGTTVDAFKTWLSTHNMTVVYELDSAASETFDGAVIPVSATEQEVTVDTELIPYSIEAVTFGDYYTKSEVDKLINNLDTRLKALEPSTTSLDED